MAQRRGLVRALALAVVSSAAAVAVAVPPPPASRLFARIDEQCAVGFLQCPQESVPANFCCPRTATCQLLARGTTLVCCPEGSDCAKIQPITCDLAQQDPKLHPDAPIKTTALAGTLPKCGDLCCPFGYECTGDNKCRVSANQNSGPKQSTTTSSPSTTSPTAAGSSSAAPTATTTTGGAAENPPPASQATVQPAGDFPTGSVVGGVLGGAIALVLIGLAVFLFCRRRKKSTYWTNRSTSSFGNILSHPVTISSPKLVSEGRTDFVRKSPPAASSSPLSASRDSGRFVSAAAAGRGWATPSPLGSRDGSARDDSPAVLIPPIRSMRSGGGAPAAGGPPPVTPPRQRQPSIEIDVYVAPGTVGSRRGPDDRKTTFTDMLHQAGLDDVAGGGRFVPATPSLQGSPMARGR